MFKKVLVMPLLVISLYGCADSEKDLKNPENVNYIKSYSEMINRSESHGNRKFTYKSLEYAMDSGEELSYHDIKIIIQELDVDWVKQGKKELNSYLKNEIGYSKSELLTKFEENEYTDKEIKKIFRGIKNSEWEKQAEYDLNSTIKYLNDFGHKIEPSEVIKILKRDWKTKEELKIINSLENSFDWDSAIDRDLEMDKIINNAIKNKKSRNYLIKQLQEDKLGFSYKEIMNKVDNLDVNWDAILQENIDRLMYDENRPHDLAFSREGLYVNLKEDLFDTLDIVNKLDAIPIDDFKLNAEYVLYSYRDDVNSGNLSISTVKYLMKEIHKFTDEEINHALDVLLVD